MPQVFNEELNVEELIPIHNLFRQFSEEAIDLRITEKFFAEVERRMLKTNTTPFNIDVIKAALHKLKNLPKDSPPLEFWQVDFQLKQEFQTWRNILQKHDSKLETYHLRRFCDSTQEPLDNAVYSALARFYRGVGHSASTQSKFDLVMTRLFASERGQAHRAILLPREQLIERLRNIFDSWDGNNKSSTQLSDRTLKNIEKIDGFIAEANSLQDFEGIIKSNLFERYRKFKNGLGKKFYEPAIIAVALECNLAVGNAFNTLLGNANQNLSTKLNASFEFSEAFHDTSPNAQIHISEVLSEFKVHESLNPESPEYEELRHVWELLEHIGTENGIVLEDEILPKSGTNLSLPPQDRINPILVALQNPEANARLLRDYMQKSEALKLLDLNDFLNFKDDNITRVCRDALGLIIWAEEIRENELNQPKNIPLTIRDEVKTILRKSHNSSDYLKLLTEVADERTQKRLLIVTNKLLESSLKLERAIIRFSNRNLGISKDDPPKEEKEEVTSLPTPEEANSTATQPQAKGWIYALLLLGLLAGGLIYFATKQLSNVVPAVQEVEKLDTKALPHGELMRVAYRKKSALFITVQDDWAKLPKLQQKETLENLLNYPAKTKLEVVVLTDGAGKPVGQISADGVNTSENFQIAENIIVR